MRYKRGMILMVLAVFLFAIATVSANDANDTMLASEDTSEIELSANDEIGTDNLQTDDKEQLTVQENNEELINGNDNGTLQTESSSEGTYYDLRDEIGNGGNKILTKSYYRYTGGDTIEITTSGVINGNGAIIDMCGLKRAFHVSASDVTIKNLTIKNGYYYSSGGAIYFANYGTVENCTFTGNLATNGGAIFGGSAVNCTFTDNLATNGGAMRYSSAVNCTFTGNRATNGGAMSGGSAFLCIFETSSDTIYDTIIPTFTVSKSVLRFDSGDKLLFNLTFGNENYNVYPTTITLSKDGNPVGVYSVFGGSDEGWFVDLSPGAYRATLNMGPCAVNPISVAISVGIDAGLYSELSSEIGSGENYIELQHDYYVYDYGSTIELNKPNTVIDGKGAVIDMAGSSVRAFTVNASNVTIKDLTIKNANFDGYGGAIYNEGTLTIFNTNLSNNKARNGGAIYNKGTLTIFNTNFTNNTAYYSGGAIYNCLRNSISTITINDNTFTDNVAENKGGAIYNKLLEIEGAITIKDNIFTDNAAEDGTAIYTDYRGVDLQSIDLEDNNFNSDNYTFNAWDDYTSITVVGNTLEDIQNAVDDAKDGYTIYLEGIEYSGTTEIHVNKSLTFIGKENTILHVPDAQNIFNINQDAFNITFKNIRFTQGGINFVGGNLNIINCTIDSNFNMDWMSSVVRVDNPDSNVTVLNSSVANNIGYWVFYLLNVHTFIVQDCIFSNNQKNLDDSHMDSVIRCEKGVNVIINNSTFINNQHDSGNIYLDEITNLNVTNCIFEDNIGLFSSSIMLSKIYELQNNVTVNIEYCDFINNNYGTYKQSYTLYIHNPYANSIVVNMKNCNFENNSEEGLIYFYTYNKPVAAVNIDNCSFINNYGESELINSMLCDNFKIVDCIFENNSGNIAHVRGVISLNTFENCSFKNNSGYCIDIYSNGNFSISDCEFENNSGTGITFDKYGSANAQIFNCSFKNNSEGININAAENVTIMDCDFIGNSGRGINIVKIETHLPIKNVTIMDCDFISNTGGGINVQGSDSTLIANCSFINNSADRGGAILMYSNNVKIMDCNFEKNNASGGTGGAIFGGNCENVTIKNCIFTNNCARDDGAVSVYGDYSSIINCSFINNCAEDFVGAVTFGGNYSSIINCSFKDNYMLNEFNAAHGALDFSGDNALLANCTFENNKGGHAAGGFSGDKIIMSNCSFINNSGIRSTFGIGNGPDEEVRLTNCSFINNSEDSVDSSISFSSSGTLLINCDFTIENCNFINNSVKNHRENSRSAGTIMIVDSGDRIRTIVNCTFINNSVNCNGSGAGAIYVYWEHNIINLINSTFKANKVINPSLNVNNEKDSLIFTFNTMESFINAIAVRSGSPTINMYNVTYWDDGEELNTGVLVPINESLQTNQKLTIEIYDLNGALIYNISESTDDDGKLVCNYIDLPLPAGVYTYIAYHPDNDYYGYSEVTGTFEVDNSFNSLNKKVLYADSNLTLKKDYWYDSENDTAYVNGIVIDRNLTIYGNGHSIDAKCLARIFNVTGGASLTLVNVTLKNGYARDGGAIYSKGTLVILDCLFEGSNASSEGGAIYSYGNLTIVNSTIDNNTAEFGAILVAGTGNIVNSTLSNNNGEWGGAIYNNFANLTVTGSNFNGNYARVAGAGVYNYMGNVEIDNSTFKDNSARVGSALWTNNAPGISFNDVRLVDNEGEAITSYDGTPIDTSGVKFLTAPSFKIEDINNTLKGSEITINITELNKGEEFNGNVTVFIGDESFTVELVNGSGSRTVTPNLDIGTYTVKLTFNETDVYYSASAEGNPFNIMVNPEITIADISNVYRGTPVTIRVTAVESFNGELVIAINGANYTVIMVNGSGEMPVTLDPGSYNATISFPGNDYYTASNAQSNGFIVRDTTSLSAGAVTAVYNINKNLVITLKDSNGKALSGVKVTVNLNGAKTYTTDKNGQIKINVAKLVPKIYTAKITFNGNDIYDKSAKNVKVVVKKAKAKITAKKKTFKKSKKVKKYTIALKSGKKPIKKVKVTIKIGKKTFKAKTNAKGKATFKIKKLTKKGKYKAVVKFNGNKYYNKATKKVKINLK